MFNVFPNVIITSPGKHFTLFITVMNCRDETISSGIEVSLPFEKTFRINCATGVDLQALSNCNLFILPLINLTPMLPRIFLVDVTTIGGTTEKSIINLFLQQSSSKLIVPLEFGKVA